MSASARMSSHREIADRAADVAYQLWIGFANRSGTTHLYDIPADPATILENFADEAKRILRREVIHDIIGCSEEGAKLVLHAAKELPDSTLLSESLPTQGQCLVFPDKWIWRDLVHFPNPINPDLTLHQIAISGPLSWSGDPEMPLEMIAFPVWATIGDVPAKAPEHESLVRSLMAFSLLSSQRVIRESTHKPSRGVRRRARREGVGIDVVRVVALPRSISQSSGGHQDRDYSHRWMVSGHWRNQWYPKTKTHRPRWIAPYIKGPDDKPLVLKEDRYVFDPHNEGPAEADPSTNFESDVSDSTTSDHSRSAS